MGYWFGYLIILFLGGGGLIWLLTYLRQAKKPRPLFENLTLTVLTLFLTLMGLELYFKVFFAQTDTIPTLAERNWREQYYDGTFNSLGYRDVEWTDEVVAGKIKVMVVGDSFVEGVGIEYPEDRFSNRLAQKLGPDYVVFNLGKSGANTAGEIEAITHFPYRPDFLVFSYFPNDIEGTAAWQRGLARPPNIEISPLLLPLVKNSYTFNFLYWRLFRLWQAGQPDTKWLWFLSLYDNPEVWWLHQQELLSIYQGAQSEQVPLIVVVFPSMNHIEESQVVTKRIVALYEERGVPTLDVTKLIKGIPTAELMASPVDSHPNERVHALVAEALYQMFVDTGLASK